jgi:epoxide hydrolase-like predicted phosphatase
VVEAVIFDLGGVFTTSSPFDAVHRMAADLGLDGPVAVELLFGPYDHDTDHPWHRAERGELPVADCRAEVLALSLAEVGVEVDLFKLLGYMDEGGTGMREAFVARARRLRAQGVRTGLLTNNVVEFAAYWREKLPVDELFDDVVDSSEVGVRKPDEAIYRLALERLGGVAPDRAVFLDDWPGNVSAARRLGMHGIVVDLDPDAALAELDALLGW